MKLLFTGVLAVWVLCAQQPQPVKIGGTVFTGSIRTRAEGWDWFNADADSSYWYSGNIARLGIAKSHKSFDWQLEFAAPFLLGMPESAVAPGAQGQLGLGATYYVSNDRSPNAGMVFVKQGFVRFKGVFGSEAQSLRLGRFEFIDGSEVTPKSATLALMKRDWINQRLFGSFGWSHVGRSFDGFQYVFNKPRISYTLLGAIPTRGAFQVDGWGQLKVGFVYASATGQTGAGRNTGEWRAFGIYYQDWRHILKTDNRPMAVRQQDLNNIRIGTYGGHYVHAAETGAGTVDFLLWGALQNGVWGRQDHASLAGVISAGWQPKALARLKPWLRAGYSHSRGDDNPLDNQHQTFFQLLPTPRPYARFPFHNMMNNEDAFVSLLVRPHKALAIRPDIHWLRLAARNDLWFLGGGAYQPWTFGFTGRPSNARQGLANSYDVSVDYTVNASLALTGYYSYVAGHSVIAAIYPNGKNGSFGYLELNYKF